MKPTKLHEASYFVVTWFLATDDPLDAVLAPEYWAHVASHLRPHHRIIVDATDGTWTATLFVRSATRTDAMVSVMSFCEIGAPIADDSDEFKVSWGGPAQKFRVVRLSDSAVVQSGFDTREAANGWLLGHMKTLAA